MKAVGAGAIGWPLLPAWAKGYADAPPATYNGIRLPRPWPPDWRSLPDHPIAPPYLVAPPDVIPIDIGRQLFVDDFLVEETTLSRTFHQAEYYTGNPVLWPNTQWEKYDEYAERTKTRSNPAAMVFSDGVFYDARDRLFKMWYMGGYSQNTCYAFSHDGLSWEKPSLDVICQHHAPRPSRFVNRVARSDGSGSARRYKSRVLVRQLPDAVRLA